MNRTSAVLCIMALCICTLLWAGSAVAKVTYQYFEALDNCDGGGGWLVMDHGADGSVNIHVLCDGGSGGPLNP